ncbi:MAG: hypothetical protein GY768_05545 [Planctomycetaceae bacterium]|nr:hypothetical protein [Planctomycetaceae bacterium]
MEIPNLFWPLILLVVALGILCLELFIPSGGLLSIMSGLLLVGAIITAFVTAGSFWGGVFTATTVSLLPIVFILFLRWWPKTAIGRRVLIKPKPADELVPAEVQVLRELIGQRGTTVTPMLPSGAVRLAGQTIDAISEGMAIDVGTEVEVVAAKGNHLVVRPTTTPGKTTDKADFEQPLDAIVPDPFEDPLP